MKCTLGLLALVALVSLPVRGAWVEIRLGILP